MTFAWAWARAAGDVPYSSAGTASGASSPESSTVLPRVALAPFFILWFGIGLASKVALVVSVVGFVVLFNVRQGIDAIDPVMLDAMHSMRASRWQTTRNVVIPSVVPWLMAAIKISIGMAIVSAVVGELIGSTEGLGWYMTQAINQFDITGAITALLTMALLAMLMYGVVGIIERGVCRWADREHVAHRRDVTCTTRPERAGQSCPGLRAAGMFVGQVQRARSSGATCAPNSRTASMESSADRPG